ncbi:MAG: hypothetical protein LBB40_00215 [Holophagales bacterium]|jgi:hypothetical protein|nr:hypothetical protein [Holophagales bacterium]
MRNSTTKIFIVALLLAWSPLFSQRNPGQWVNDYFMVDTDEFVPSKLFLDKNDKLQKSITSVSKATDFPLGRRYVSLALWSFWRNDALYTSAVGPTEKESGIRHITLAKYTNNAWEHIGTLNVKAGTVVMAIPCDNDRFIAIYDSDGSDLTGNEGTDRSPFARLSIRPGSKELRIDAALHDASIKSMNDPEWFGLPFNSKIAITDKYAVAVNSQTGLYWIFSLEKASLTRSGRIFKKVTDEMISKGGFPKAILCVHPEKDGNILISAQDEAAFITETADPIKEINEILQTNPTLSPQDALMIIRKRTEELADKNWYMNWYRIYPENGKIEKLGLPPLGGTVHREGLKNDAWRPMPDGSVKMGRTLNKQEPELSTTAEKNER